MAPAGDEEEIESFLTCPAAVRKTFQVEAKGAKIESVTKEKDEDAVAVYRANLAIGGKQRMRIQACMEDGHTQRDESGRR